MCMCFFFKELSGPHGGGGKMVGEGQGKGESLMLSSKKDGLFKFFFRCIHLH